MASISLQANRDWDNFTVDNEPLLFSDEEDQYNYYTDEDAEISSCSTEYESENEHSKWDFERMIRGFGALMVPVMASLGLGAYLAHLQGKKPPQAWFFGSSSPSDPEAPVILNKNELKGRCKALQYPANLPC